MQTTFVYEIKHLSIIPYALLLNYSLFEISKVFKKLMFTSYTIVYVTYLYIQLREA